MGALFHKPSVPEIKMPEAPPPVPRIDDALKAREETDRRLRRRGRKSTIFTGPDGAPVPGSASAVLGQ